jgi:hypothetical protein
VASVSAREPASIHTPTVAVWEEGLASVAMVSPFERVEISVAGVDGSEAELRTVAYRRVCARCSRQKIIRKKGECTCVGEECWSDASAHCAVEETGVHGGGVPISVLLLGCGWVGVKTQSLTNHVPLPVPHKYSFLCPPLVSRCIRSVARLASRHHLL